MTSSPFLYPNVSRVPNQDSGTTSGKIEKPQKGEFDREVEKALQTQTSGLDQIKAPLKFSAHASHRLNERKITLDPTTMSKVNDAVDKAAAKGVDDTLVLTDKAALIVNVKNRTVVTALDRNSLSGNVFTNIDGAVIV